LTGHEHLPTTEEPAKKRGTSLFSPSPLQMCRKRESKRSIWAIFGGGRENIDNGEIRLTSVRLVGIEGDLGAKSRRAKSQRSLIQRTDGCSEHGRLPASCFCCRTELLVGKIGDWRLFPHCMAAGKGYRD